MLRDSFGSDHDCISLDGEIGETSRADPGYSVCSRRIADFAILRSSKDCCGDCLRDREGARCDVTG